jgi:hypothetical protein
MHNFINSLLLLIIHVLNNFFHFVQSLYSVSDRVADEESSSQVGPFAAFECPLQGISHAYIGLV